MTLGDPHGVEDRDRTVWVDLPTLPYAALVKEPRDQGEFPLAVANLLHGSGPLGKPRREPCAVEPAQ